MTPIDAMPSLSRRALLQAGGAAALTIGFVLPRSSRAKTAASPLQPNARVRLTGDGLITVICGSAEMGHGVLTAIPMLLAE